MTDRRIHERPAERLAALLALSADDGEGEPTVGPEPSAPALKLSVPGYRLLRELSRGGQAVVYQAVQESTGRRVAVKVLREGPLASPSERARLEREVQVLAALRHPNLVVIVDRGTTPDGWLYLVTDYIPGRPLDAHLRIARRAPGDDPPGGAAAPSRADALRLMLKICDAVNAAHLRGIIHRDLKPSNILVDDAGEPHVLDFGLARTGIEQFTDETCPAPITVTGQFVGSLPWASPEQAEGLASAIDQRSDVYSLGVILYQVLTGGRFPYKVEGSMSDVLQSIIHSEVTPPSRVGGPAVASRPRRKLRLRPGRHDGIDPGIEAVVLKALAKRPADRYPNAGALARDLENYLSGRPTAAGPAGRRAGSLVAAAAVLFATAAVVAVAAYKLGQRRDVPDALAAAVGRDGPADARPAPAVAAAAAAAPVVRAPGPGPSDVRRPEPVPARGDERVRFTVAASIRVGHGANGLAVADLNADGKLDLAVAQRAWDTDIAAHARPGDPAGKVKILLGRGDGTFDAPIGFPTFIGPAGDPLVTDFNADGLPDLAVGESPLECVTFAVLLNRGGGRFSSPQLDEQVGPGPVHAAAADFDGDRKPDLAVVNAGSDAVRVLRGRGDGTFESPTRVALGQRTPRFLVARDFNGDGHADLLVCHSEWPHPATEGSLTFVPGDGRGGFGPAARLDDAGAVPASVAVADFNADGVPDLAYGDGGYSRIGTLLGRGDGRFRPGPQRGIATGADSVAAADLDGDGKVDLIGARVHHARLRVHFGAGDGTLTDNELELVTPTTVREQPGPHRVVAADLNGDGRVDLVTTDYHAGTVSVLLNAR